MIITKCNTCSKDVFVAESEEEAKDQRSTKYWSYEKDGTKRPYCDAFCGLIDYQNKQQEQK